VTPATEQIAQQFPARTTRLFAHHRSENVNFGKPIKMMSIQIANLCNPHEMITLRKTPGGGGAFFNSLIPRELTPIKNPPYAAGMPR
jgi:hypothetical protein